LKSRRLGIEQKRIAGRVQKQMPVQFSFRVQNARFNRPCLVCLTNIVAQLPVQKTQPIGAADSQLCARGKIDKYAVARLRRHFWAR
jgi:hypothetical protein